AMSFVNDCYLQWEVCTATAVKLRFGAIQQAGQGLHALLPTGRAAVDGGVIQCDGACVRTAAVIAAFCALSLRKHRIYAVDEQGGRHKKTGAVWAPVLEW